MPERMAAARPKYTPFELAWFSFVRLMPCRAKHLGRCDGDVVAAHITLSANEKGWGMKVPHDQTAPLCCKHHDDWDGRNGRTGNPFADMPKEERYTLGAEWVADVREAAIPDERDQANDYETIGIGKVIGDGTPTGWRWLPGPLTEVPL